MMEAKSKSHKRWSLGSCVAFGLAVLVVGGCAGGGGLATVLAAIKISGFEPLKATAGSIIKLFGTGFLSGSAPTVTVAGVPVKVKSITDTEMEIEAPAGVSGPIKVSNGTSTASSTGSFESNAPTVVNEVEPNNDPSGSNATHDGGNRIVAGVLSSVDDRDFYTFDDVVPGVRYVLQLTPRVVDTVTVDGVTEIVDAVGQLTFRPSNKNVLIGLGGAGSSDAPYQASVSRL